MARDAAVILGRRRSIRTYLLVKANDPTAFPHLPSYRHRLARLHRLTRQIGLLLDGVPVNITDEDELFLIDSHPVKMCEAIRHGRVNLLRDDGAYFGKGTTGWFFGFKLHIVSTRRGRILGAVFLPTKYDDREGARRLASLLEEESLCVADLSYRGDRFQRQMYEEEGVLFLTRADIESESLKITHSLLRERIARSVQFIVDEICRESLFKKLERAVGWLETKNA